MRVKSHWLCLGFLVCFLLLVIVGQGENGQPSFAVSAHAQTAVTVTSPTGAPSDAVAEGEDFFTHDVGDRRSMDERLDLRWQMHVSNISVSNGIWQGDFQGGGAVWIDRGSVYIHYPGFDRGAANVGPIGTQYPIDADTYRQLSFRMYSPSNSTYRLTSFDGLIEDGQRFVGPEATPTQEGWNTYIAILSNGWSGQKQGLRIFPTEAGGVVQFDWIRLTNPDTSPTFDITWTGPGSGTVDIYCDDDTNPADTIAQIADDEPDDGSFTWETAAFPPGDYYIYIEHSDDSPGGGDYSDGPLTIVPAPILDFTAPSMLSGDDYATVELGNLWDMDSWSDVLSDGTWDWTWHHLNPATVSFDGQLHATTSGNDPFIYLNVDISDNPIDTSKYKYLSWRGYVEGDWINSFDRLPSLNGWVTRFHYFVTYPYSHTLDMNTLNDVIVWEGWNTYTVDLSQPGYLDNKAPGPGPGWTGVKRGIRFDFLEGSFPSNIHVDWVRLTADPAAQAGGTYDIEWEVQASDRYTVITLKYDDDQDPDNGFAGDIVTLGLSPGEATPLNGPYFVYLPLVVRNYPLPEATGSYTWDIPGHLAGAYYIYAELDDRINVVGWYSEVPLVINP